MPLSAIHPAASGCSNASTRFALKRNWPSKSASMPFSGPPHEKILRAIRLFGEKVIPKLA
jgi:hypothetical protein